MSCCTLGKVGSCCRKTKTDWPSCTNFEQPLPDWRARCWENSSSGRPCPAHCHGECSRNNAREEGLSLGSLGQLLWFVLSWFYLIVIFSREILLLFSYSWICCKLANRFTWKLNIWEKVPVYMSVRLVSSCLAVFFSLVFAVQIRHLDLIFAISID